MADGRMVKRKISTDVRFADLANDTHRLLFTVGIAHLDIEGRISGDPREFKAIVAPMLDHITQETVLKFFEDASGIGLIHRYCGGDQWVIQYPGFKKNQILRPDREAQSKFPPPTFVSNEGQTDPITLRKTPGGLQEDCGSTPPQIKTKEVKLKKDSKKSPEISSEISSLVEKIFPFPEDKDLFNAVKEAIFSTRKAGKVSDSIILAQLKAWGQYPPSQVHGGIKVYLSKECHKEGKNEKYLLGIIRNQPQAEMSPGLKSTGSPMLDAYYREKIQRSDQK